MAQFKHISELLLEILPVILPEPQQNKKSDKTEEPSVKEEVLTDG